MSADSSAPHPSFGCGSKLVTVKGGPRRDEESYWVMSFHPSLCFRTPSRARANELLADWNSPIDSIADSFSKGRPGDTLTASGGTSVWVSLIDQLQSGQLRSDAPHFFMSNRDGQPVYDSQGNWNLPKTDLRQLISSFDTHMQKTVTLGFTSDGLPARTIITVADLTERTLGELVANPTSWGPAPQQASDRGGAASIESWLQTTD
ncbi:hypothetical protein EHS25_005232 [Saitozyma podzolica]|uniref:Uncharacterized protein n=1 Tax=Saitozyma podzolica TaxID=1890683 RepID=A0A427XYV8_9TREE|nr:hypothetical protein EHS25_005232 [Saitozyma podzolica]